ncbi:MAG: sporulation protein YtfJ [Desulfitobacterium sp.]|nr:sporulation protein YtfJ [Desulfitobacterium sp.]
MGNHPIEALMKTAMESIQQMVDVNTIVGDPIESPDGSVIIPVSRVSCGFAAGGSEFAPPEGDSEGNQDNNQDSSFPFGGGSGAGVSVQPVGFLVVGHGQIRLLPVDHNVLIDRLFDEVPNLMDKVTAMFKKENPDKELCKEDIIIVNEH